MAGREPSLLISDSQTMAVTPARVTSIDDERLSLFRNVRDADLRGRENLFLVESETVVRRLIASRFAVHSLLVSETKLQRMRDVINVLPESVTVIVAEHTLMTAIAGYRIHGGVLALGVRPLPEHGALRSVLDHLGGRDRLLVVLAERVTHVDNIGALFRNAAAFGVDAVVLDSTCADPFLRKSIRTSMGHLLSIPFAIADNWTSALDQLRHELGLALLACESGANALPISELPRIDRLGLIFGSERHGLSDATRNACDGIVEIPMAAGVPSLNVATAAAVCLYERRRGEVPTPARFNGGARLRRARALESSRPSASSPHLD